MTPFQPSWRRLYRVGAVAALATLLGTLSDIALAALPGWETSTVPTSGLLWFEQFHTRPLLGLRNLDLLNVIVSIVGIPMYVALYGALSRRAQGLATLALVVVALGTSVFVARNAALPMWELSRQFSAATTETQRLALLGSAQAALAAGAHGSLGAFAGFFLSTIGTLLMAVAMLTSDVFPRRVAWTGVIGTSLLLSYVVGTTFSLAPRSALLWVALPGGLMTMTWNAWVAQRLVALASVPE